MKNPIVFLLTAGILWFSACAQTSINVPPKVRVAFEQKFPNAQKVSWGSENASEWEAEFTINGKECTANYNPEGMWLETEYEIAMSEVPAVVVNSLEKEFPESKIRESEISETAVGKKYEFEIKTANGIMEAVVDTEGKIMSKAPIKDKQDKKD